MADIKPNLAFAYAILPGPSSTSGVEVELSIAILANDKGLVVNNVTGRLVASRFLAFACFYYCR